MCTALLQPRVKPIGFNKYILSYNELMKYIIIIIIIIIIIFIIINLYTSKTDSGAARSEAWVCRCPLVRIAGSYPTAVALRFVSCECRVLSGRDLCVGLITRPEESYGVWGVRCM